MSPRTVTPAEAQEMLDGATPGPWAAEYDVRPELHITQAHAPHEDIATELDATDVDARLMAAARTLLDALAGERRAWSAPLSGLPLPRYGGGPAETAAREVAEAALRALAPEVKP